MKTTYLTWKDPTCNGINPEWLELSGKEFYALVRSQEGKSRFFIKLENHYGDASDSMIVMEATLVEYRIWRKEKDHSDLVREGKQEKEFTTVSYDALDDEDGDSYGEEMLADIESDFASSSIDKILLESLAVAMKKLSPDELWLIDMIYRDEKSLSEVGESLGMSKQAVFKRLNKILAKLKSRITRK